MSTPHLVIMAAGTGGHIIPGLAVAREMRTRGWSVSWLGTRHGMENRLVPPAGIELDTVAFAGLRGKGWAGRLRGSAQLMTALRDSGAILRRRGATAVLGMGGYVCLPGGLMAALQRRPLVLVNADAALLLSNRLLTRLARRVCLGFDGVAARELGRRGLVTGNPVRAEIEALPRPAERFEGRSGPLRLLVVGGSLGARVLNETVPDALALIPAERRPVVVHQTGADHLASVQADYARHGLVAEVKPFIEDMAQAYAQADLVICRAGAVTVSELCAAGVPAILVPLIVSTTSHQVDNASWMAEQRAAIHLPQSELNAPALAALLGRLDRVALQGLAEKARGLARPRAARLVADAIEAAAGLREIDA